MVFSVVSCFVPRNQPYLVHRSITLARSVTDSVVFLMMCRLVMTPVVFLMMCRLAMTPVVFLMMCRLAMTPVVFLVMCRLARTPVVFFVMFRLPGHLASLATLTSDAQHQGRQHLLAIAIYQC